MPRRRRRARASTTRSSTSPSGELFGCVYLYPSDAPGADADVSWWVVDAARGSDLERALDTELPRWFESAWGFASVRRHPGPPADG